MSRASLQWIIYNCAHRKKCPGSGYNFWPPPHHSTCDHHSGWPLFGSLDKPHHSAKVHGPCHAFMRLPEDTLKPALVACRTFCARRIGILCCDVRREVSLILLWVVMIFGT